MQVVLQNSHNTKQLLFYSYSNVKGDHNPMPVVIGLNSLLGLFRVFQEDTLCFTGRRAADLQAFKACPVQKSNMGPLF